MLYNISTLTNETEHKQGHNYNGNKFFHNFERQKKLT